MINHSLVSQMRIDAACGEFDGRVTSANERYLRICQRADSTSGTVLIFTRDTGHHTSGWFKNPDYERCQHLSLSFFEPGGRVSAARPFDTRMAQSWARAFFRDSLRLVWIEPAASRAGKLRDVQHFRLFCDEHWRPIHPRGEVYSTEFTERGWKSATEIFGETGQPEPVSILRP